MSNEKFKREIKGFDVPELLEKYRKLSVEVHKWQGINSGEYSRAKAGNNKLTSTQGVSQVLPKLKKQRAIVLTRLNQLGWNGKELRR